MAREGTVPQTTVSETVHWRTAAVDKDQQGSYSSDTTSPLNKELESVDRPTGDGGRNPGNSALLPNKGHQKDNGNEPVPYGCFSRAEPVTLVGSPRERRALWL